MSRSAALWPGPASRLRPPLSLPWAAVLAAGACAALAFGLSARWQQRLAASPPPVLWVQPVSPPAVPVAAPPVAPSASAATPAPPDVASPPPSVAPTPRKEVATPAQSRRTAPAPASRTPASQDARPEQTLPADADSVSALVTEAPPGAGSHALAAPAAAPASEPAQAPAAAASPQRSDARTVCPVQVEPRWPEAIYTEALADEAEVRTLARVRDGRVVSVDILSGPRVLHRAVREAMLQYRCQTLPGVTHEITQDFRFRQEGVR